MCACTHAHVCIYVCVHACVCVYVCMYAYVCVCMHVCVCVCMQKKVPMIVELVTFDSALMPTMDHKTVV